MKHAILITAYTDLFRLIELILSFKGLCDIYVHIDKQYYMSHSGLQILSSIKGVKLVMQKYSINWGGRNHLDAILDLCHQAYSNSPNAEYFHLISGNDLLIKRMEYFNDFFEHNKGIDFLESFSLPYQGWTGGGLNRIEYVHPLDRLNIRNEGQARIYQRYLQIQLRSKHTRELPVYALYGGSSWWSLTSQTIKYIIDNYNWMGWYDRLKDTFAPDELYVQTLLMNSPRKDEICNNNLRYISWTMRNGNMPAILDEQDKIDLIRSNAIFARKVDSRISNRLISFFTQ